MHNEEVRQWLGLTRADLFLYLAAAAIIAMFFVDFPIAEFGLAAAALVLSLTACVFGMKTSTKASPLTKTAKKVAYPASVVLTLLFIIYLSLDLTYCQIPQNGMFPGMPAGSRLFAVRTPYLSPSEVSRGDIVVFTRVENDKQYKYIWRVIGLPGDEVRTFGDELNINGREVNREETRKDGEIVIYKETNGDAVYEVAYSTTPPQSAPRDATLTVPPGHFFVLGDNRHNARDSRYFGPIPFESIIAKKW